MTGNDARVRIEALGIKPSFITRVPYDVSMRNSSHGGRRGGRHVLTGLKFSDALLRKTELVTVDVYSLGLRLWSSGFRARCIEEPSPSLSAVSASSSSASSLEKNPPMATRGFLGFQACRVTFESS